MAEDVGEAMSELTTVKTLKVLNITEGQCFAGGEELGIDVLGLVSIIIFYIAVLGVIIQKKEVQIQNSL